MEQYHLIVDLLQRIPHEALDSVTVVGGQAMLFWALRYAYQEDSPLDFSAEERAAVTSSDLDFYSTNHQAIESCASVWHGEVTYPRLDDHTPNTAIVQVFSKPGESYDIDFLGSLKGIDEKSLEALWDSFRFKGEEVRFLSPPLCLASRIHNYCGLGYGEEKLAREKKRIAMAIKLTRKYLNENLDYFLFYGQPNGYTRPTVSLGVLRFLNDLFVHQDTTDVVMATGINPMEAIPEDHPGWPEMTRDRHIPNIVGKARDHYRRKAQHKYEHLKGYQSIPPGVLFWLNS